MTRIPFRPFPTRVRLDQLLRTSALALLLTTLPVGIEAGAPALHWQAAVAKSDGGSGGGGGGHGGGHGGGGHGGEHGKGPGERGGHDGVPGSRGHAYGREAAQGGAAGGPGYHDVRELVDSVRNGKALGLERRDERVEQAKGRYAAALGKADQARPDDGAVGPVAHRFSAEETEALMARGWKGPAARDAGFRNHGERVSTMVELSKRLGYGARAGALQANFGTPQENGIAALEAELAEAEAAGDLAAAERLEAELAEAIANAKPGNGPDDSWATADLDVNDDGVVDGHDLEALEPSEAGVDAAGDASAG
jgi:hypothetical protein